MAQDRAARIAALNDQFRKNPLDGNGQIVMSRAVHALGAEFALKALSAIAAFDSFSRDNDPYGEHDFGSVEVDGEKFFFKFDYYDPTHAMYSEDPADQSKTERVLTIMLASEY